MPPNLTANTGPALADRSLRKEHFGKGDTATAYRDCDRQARPERRA